MTLPLWAQETFEQFKPQPAYRQTEPDATSLKAWHTLAQRFEALWSEIDAIHWDIPQGMDRDTASRTVLECAITCAKHNEGGKTPSATAAAIAELEKTNSEIKTAALALADLFRKRQEVIDESLLDDWPDQAPDPFRFWDATELLAGSHPGMDSVVRLAMTGGQPPGDWVNMLELVGQRDAGHIAPVLAIGLADTKSQKTEGWAPLARRFFVVLDNTPGIDGRALREGLSYRQTAALLRAAYGANEDAINEEKIKAWKHTLKASRAKHQAFS